MPQPIDISAGCITTATGDADHPITFSHHAKILLSITPEGEMIIGPGLSASSATQAIVALLVDEWGQAYGQRLRKAETRIRTAEAAQKKAENELLMWKHAAKRAGVEIDVRRHHDTTKVASDVGRNETSGLGSGDLRDLVAKDGGEDIRKEDDDGP